MFEGGERLRDGVSLALKFVVVSQVSSYWTATFAIAKTLSHSTGKAKEKKITQSMKLLN